MLDRDPDHGAVHDEPGRLQPLPQPFGATPRPARPWCAAAAARIPRRRCAPECRSRAFRSRQMSATWRITASPTSWPKRSLIDLKTIDVEEQQRQRLHARARAGAAHPRRAPGSGAGCIGRSDRRSWRAARAPAAWRTRSVRSMSNSRLAASARSRVARSHVQPVGGRGLATAGEERHGPARTPRSVKTKLGRSGTQAEMPRFAAEAPMCRRCRSRRSDSRRRLRRGRTTGKSMPRMKAPGAGTRMPDRREQQQASGRCDRQQRPDATRQSSVRSDLSTRAGQHFDLRHRQPALRTASRTRTVRMVKPRYRRAACGLTPQSEGYEHDRRYYAVQRRTSSA